MTLDRNASVPASHSGASSQSSSSSIYTHNSTATQPPAYCSSATDLSQGGPPRRPSTQLVKQVQEIEQIAHSDGSQDQHPYDCHTAEPPSNRFDSLQDLLEQAGYKVTRVITPQPKRLVDMSESKRDSMGSIASDASPTITRHLGNRSSSALREGGRGRQDRQIQGSLPPVSAIENNAVDSVQALAAGTSWFTNFWKAANGKTPFESASDVQSGSGATRAGAVAAPPSTLEHSVATTPNVRKTLASKASTLSLWKGSRARRGVVSTTPSLQSSSPNRLGTKGSLGHLRGGGNAASVGVGISAYDGGAAALSSLRRSASRASLQSPSGSTTIQAVDAESESAFAAPLVGGSIAAIEEWRQSLVSAKTSRQSAVAPGEELASDDVETPPKPKLRSVASSHVAISKDLFASLAGPVVSSEAAVAPRNSECFKGPEARGLRHAKSVEALRSALNQKRRPDLKSSHSVIGQGVSVRSKQGVPPLPTLASYSSDASLASLLRDHQARTVYRDAIPGQTNDEAIESPERSRGPPVLTLTSPSGVHSPQVVRLEGQEFDPRTFSPPTSIESKRLMSGNAPPEQRRNFDDLVSVISHRGRSRSRASKCSTASARTSSHDGNHSGADSEPSSEAVAMDEAALRRRTRRGCRAGKKHGRSIKNLAAAATADAERSDAPSIPQSIAFTSEQTTEPIEPAEPTGASRAPSAESSTMSFGSASETIVTNGSFQTQDDEEDPFIAHVKAREEAKRSDKPTATAISQKTVKGCRTNTPSPHPPHGMASILGSRRDDSHDNDENAFPNDSTDRPLTARSRQGRIIGRSRPTSGASSKSSGCELPRSSLDSQAQLPGTVHVRPTTVASAVPLRAMSSPSELAHQRNGSWDSPTKEVAHRIKKMRSRRF